MHNKICGAIAFTFVSCGCGLSAEATAQVNAVILAQAQQEAIEGVVTNIEGQRLQVRSLNGDMRWFTTKTPLLPSYVGMKVTGAAVPAGDIDLLLNPVFSQ